MLLPQDLRPKFDEIITLLSQDCGEPNKSKPIEPFWMKLLESETRERFIPTPTVAPRYTMEWTHKKGKRKPQQFWIYCEESQQNYLRAEFTAQGFVWTPHSAICHSKNYPELLFFVEDYDPEIASLNCLAYNKNVKKHFKGSLPSHELQPIPSEKFYIDFKILSDDIIPIHPQQGRPEEVNITKEVLPDRCLPFPFSFIGKFTFKNREEGWYKLESSLHFQGECILRGHSDIFMFNNPRMKKKKHLSCFSPSEIKLMQVYSMRKHRDEDYWFDVAMQVGHGQQRTLELLSLAITIFSKDKSASGNVLLPPLLMSSCSTPHLAPKIGNKRVSISGQTLPVGKRSLFASPAAMRSVSLPALQFLDSPKKTVLAPLKIQINTSPRILPMDRNPKRAESGPVTSIGVRLPSLGVVPPPAFRCALSNVPSVSRLTTPPISVYYQYLTQDLSLSASLKIIHCPKSVSMDQFIFRIEQQERNKTNEIRHLYGLQEGCVLELMDTFDLHSLFTAQQKPVVLVSVYPDQTFPSTFLFSVPSSLPFYPQKAKSRFLAQRR